MLRVLGLVVLLLPGAAAWSVDLHAPARAGAGLPYLVEACVDVPGEWHLNRAPYAAVDVGCHDLVATEENLTVRLRPPGGSSKAVGVAHVALEDAPVATVRASGVATLLDGEGHAILRVPEQNGTAFLPLLANATAWRDATGDHALPRPDVPTLLEYRGPPFSGILLRNDGAAPLWLAGRSIGAPLPDLTLAPGTRIFLGAKAPPDAPWLAWEVPKKGPWILRAAQREEGRADVPATRLGRTDLLPTTLHGNVSLFALPDAGASPLVAMVDGAQREILVEGYTLTSVDIAASLARALDRGAQVRILLEGAPVGGRPQGEAAIVSALVARGAHIAFLGGEGAFSARYATVHAKTFVVDRTRVLVSTDNFHDSSYPPVPGGGGTRGFGAIVDDAEVAAVFADVFEADDAGWPDVHAADDATPPASLIPRAGAATSQVFEAGPVDVTPVFSPDDSLSNATVLGMLSRARDRIDVEMLFADARFGNASNPFLDGLVAAARRNVTVHLLLDGRDDAGRNGATVARLRALAQREGIPLEARVDTPKRLLHAKLVVADDDVYVGSMNWGFASATRNREAGVILRNATDAARWLRGVVDGDWAPKPNEHRAVPSPEMLVVLLTMGAAAARRSCSPRIRAGARAGQSGR